MSRSDRRVNAALYAAAEARKAAGATTQSRVVALGLSFVLPMPPSVNNLHRIGAGDDQYRRYLVPEQRDYRRAVVAIIGPTQQPVATRLALAAEFTYANRRVTDLDNRLKALQDALRHANVYKDDAQIDEVHLYRIVKTGGPEFVQVTITNLAPSGAAA